MSAHKFYQLRCDYPNCRASKVGGVNEVPSRMRKKRDGWETIRKPLEYPTVGGPKDYVAEDRCPGHAPAFLTALNEDAAGAGS